MYLNYETLAEFKRAAKDFATSPEGFNLLLQELSLILDNNDKLEVEFLMLKARFNRKERNKNLGTDEDHNEYNKIFVSLLQIIKSITEDDFRHIKVLKAEQDKIAELKAEISQLKGEKDYLNKKKSEFFSENSHLKDENKNFKKEAERAEKLESEIASLKLEISQKEKRIAELEAQWTKVKTDLEERIAEKTTLISALQKENADLEQKLGAKEKDFSLLSAKYEDILQKTKIRTYTETVNGVSFKMIGVEGGTFMMQNECEVTLDDFYIGETQVTQALWQTVMDDNPADFKGNLQCPIETISWEEVQVFLQKLNKITGKTYRFPSEAQWEFAARGGNKSKGYKYAGSNNEADVAWYIENSQQKTQPVRQLQANELGIYDMSGNVWERCQDFYKSDFWKNNKNMYNPKNEIKGMKRVLRGGSWSLNAFYTGVLLRYGNIPTFRNGNIGFRLLFA